MKKLIHYPPFWKNLLFISLIIISCLAIMHLSDARFFARNVVYTNKDMIQTIWSPPSSEVDHYVLLIKDTRFFSGSKERNSITMLKNVRSPLPRYQLRCEHNHSYTLKTIAVSPSGISSPFSPESTLLICDQKNPIIEIDQLPSPAKLRHPTIHLTGIFDEPNLDSISINAVPATINFTAQSFSAQIDLNPGRNYLTFLAQDLAGNRSTKNVQIDYSPVHIISSPSDAKIYWNGNYAYPGIYSGNTPQSFNQAVFGKQILRLTCPGFNDYYGIIDFSDLSQDTYTISLFPSSDIVLQHMTPVQYNRRRLSIGNCFYPFVVDYDLDGKKDLIVGTADGTIALFTNTGTESNPTFSSYNLLKAEGKDIDVGTHAAPFMVDYNNDGANDLLIGNAEGSLLYYANQGNNSHPVFASPTMLEDAEGVTIAVDSYCTPCVVDWNEDHKKDLLLGSGAGTLVVYLNQGSDSDPKFSSPHSIQVEGTELNVGSFAAPFVADWNNDGKKDLLVGNRAGYIHLYLNRSEDLPHLTKAVKVQVNGQDLLVEGSAVPFIVDWNNDGKRDLLVGCINGMIYLVL